MPLHRRQDGAWVPIAGVHVRVGGTWRAVQQGWVRVAGTWRQFFATGSPAPSPAPSPTPAPPPGPAMTVSVSPTSGGGSFDSSSSGGTVSHAYVGIPTNAVGTVTWLWQRLTTSGTAPGATGIPTSTLTLSLTYAHLAIVVSDETWRLHGTDSIGQTAFFDVTWSVDVTNGA